MSGLIKFVGILGASLAAGVLLKKFYSGFGTEAVILSAVLVVAFFAINSIQVPPRTGAVISNLLGGHRDVGPGMNFLLCFFEWRDQEVELKKQDFSFIVRLMNANRDVISMRVDFGVEPRVGYLFEYIRFEGRQRVEAIQKRIEGLLTELVHRYKNPDDVMGDRSQVESQLILQFKSSEASEMLLELYYGLQINYIFLSDIAPHPAVEDAGALKRVSEEKCKSVEVMMKGYSRSIKKLRKSDPSISHSQALEYMMAESGSAPIQVKKLDIGASLSKIADNLTKK